MSVARQGLLCVAAGKLVYRPYVAISSKGSTFVQQQYVEIKVLTAINLRNGTMIILIDAENISTDERAYFNKL